MATGIEITGLVLGAFPLLLSGVEHYAEGVDTIARWCRYERELASLKRLLIAEKVVFQGSCEQLLSGLVPASHVEELIEDPKNSKWKDGALEKKLQQRLGRSYASYLACVEDMDSVTKRLEEFLEIAPLQSSSHVSMNAKSIHHAKISSFPDHI